MFLFHKSGILPLFHQGLPVIMGPLIKKPHNLKEYQLFFVFSQVETNLYLDMGNNKDNSIWLSILTHIVIVGVTSAIIVWSLPRKSSRNFGFEIGKPWSSNTLIADFNFNIFKTEEEMEMEKNDELKNYQPYFEMDTDVGSKAMGEFAAAVQRDTTGTLSQFEEIIERRLHFLYLKGIMSNQDVRRYNVRDSINVVTGKQLNSQSFYEVFTEQSAYEGLFYDDEISKHRKELIPFNLNYYVRPNLVYDERRNKEEIDEILSNIAPSIGSVEKGEKIIDRGEVVDKDTARKLKSLEMELERRNAGKKDMTNLLFGQTLFVLTFIVLFTTYLMIFRRKYYEKPRNILMLYFLITIFPVLVSLMMRNLLISVYILPFAIVPMITQVFLDSRTAFMTHATTVLISAVAVNYQYEFIIIEMAGGLAAIFALNDMSKRAHLFKAALMATLCSALVYYAIHLIQSSEIFPSDKSMFAYLTTNGILLLLAYPLMYIIEKAFGYISNITFFELSDSNQELLRLLSEKAPGTFAHSMTVGNLASEIATAIGANVLLVRTGALYHDIGKMENPVFFTENQAGVNPHNKLSEKESAKIILSHVTYGQRLAEKYNLPTAIKDFILTHHGKGITSYFYIKYKNAHPDEDVDISAFSYPGPNPQTREQAILMMTDTVEAATKSLDEYNDEIISKKVNELIDRQVKEGFFEECPITFRDIAVAKRVLIERLKSIYHTRIKYPELNTDKKDSTTKQGLTSNMRKKNKKNK